MTSRFLQDAVPTLLGYADAISGELLKSQRDLSDPVDFYRPNARAHSFLDPNDELAPEAFIAFKRRPPSNRVFFSLQTLRGDITEVSWDFGDGSDPVVGTKAIFHTFPTYHTEYEVKATVTFGAEAPVEFDVDMLLGDEAVVPGTVSITGTARSGEMLTAEVAAWTGTNIVYTYQWQRETEASSGEYVNVYGAGAHRALTDDDIGLKLRVVVTGTNSNNAETVTSTATAAVTVAIPVNTGLPTISGTAQVGETLTATTGTWQPEAVSYAYRWLADDEAISGATSETFDLTTDELGKVVTVGVTATNPGGSSTEAVSEPTPEVIAAE